MRLFVSYSREDAAFVARLAGVLEADGHDVWVDTDDIRGSEQWRASIVEGVRSTDLVLLVVTPTSMASTNVEREVTIAAEEQRRIVPLVVQPATMSGSIRFEVAGLQQISFVEQPFEAAVAELRRELLALGPTRSALAPPAPSAQRHDRPSPAARHRRRRWPIGVAWAIVIVVAAAIVWWPDRGDDGGSAGSSEPRPAATIASTNEVVAEPEGASDVPLGAKVWFSGFEIAVERATYDEAASEVRLATTFKNTQRATADPTGILYDDTTALEWQGRRFGPYCPCNRLQGGASGRFTLEFAVGEGFQLTEAALVFGGPLQHRATIPLDGGPAASEPPRTVEAAGVIDDGAGTSFTVERVDVVPATCQGIAEDVTFAPASADEWSVLVVGTGVTTAEYGVYLGVALLVLPDGTRIASSTLGYALYRDQPKGGMNACFNVPAPVTGQYGLIVKADNVEADPPPLILML